MANQIVSYILCETNVFYGTDKMTAILFMLSECHLIQDNAQEACNQSQVPAR